MKCQNVIMIWTGHGLVWPWPKLTPRPHAEAAYLCCRNAGVASCTFVSDSSRYFLTNSWIPFFPGSIYSTLAVAIERYVSVCHPHFTPPHCTGNLSVAALLIFSFLFNSLRFVEFRTVYDYRVSELPFNTKRYIKCHCVSRMITTTYKIYRY